MEGIRIACLYSLGCPELENRPDDKQAVLSFIKNPQESEVFRVKTILMGLEPYLFYYLIGLINGEKDFFQKDIVRNYWLGGNLLKPIKENVIKEISSRKFPLDILRKLQKLEGRKPHHNTSVFQLIAGIRKPPSQIPLYLLESMNNCLVVPAKVTRVDRGRIETETLSIIRDKERFFLTAISKKVKRGFVDSPKRGDFISIHFGVAREKISPTTAEDLRVITYESFQLLQRGR